MLLLAGCLGASSEPVITAAAPPLSGRLGSVPVTTEGGRGRSGRHVGAAACAPPSGLRAHPQGLERSGRSRAPQLPGCLSPNRRKRRPRWASRRLTCWLPVCNLPLLPCTVACGQRRTTVLFSHREHVPQWWARLQPKHSVSPAGWRVRRGRQVPRQHPKSSGRARHGQASGYRSEPSLLS